MPHDVEGLVNLMGGEDAFVQKLDSLFSADSSLEGETTSSDISGLIGQYAHGNEPSHQPAFHPAGESETEADRRFAADPTETCLLYTSR